MTKYAQVTEYGIVQLSGLTPLQRRMTPAGLRKSGIYAYEDNPPSYDERYYHLGSSVEFDGEKVTKTYTIFPIDLETFKERKIVEIQSASNAAFAMMQSGYTVGEVQSFGQQQRGAADILAGNTETEDAQYVAALAAARAVSGDEGMTALELAGRIVANAAAAAQATITILGMQQGLEVRARRAETVEELEAIMWSMPESS